MRIVHLSDIHLSVDNIISLRNHYKESLINNLLNFHREKAIDLIIISGDIVDKAGKSLLKVDEYLSEIDPYKIFEIEFIDILSKELTFPKNKILFIAGNHDIDRDEIDEIQEEGLKHLIKNPIDSNRIYESYKNKPHKINISRLKRFLEFEKRFHEGNIELDYKLSDFTSTAIYNFNGNKVGIALVNDSWRCGIEEVKEHFIGVNQLHEARNRFMRKGTSFNIAVLHHPLSVLNKEEREELETILKIKEYNLLLLGHEHSSKTDTIGTSLPNLCYCIRGRSAFDNPNATHVDYVSGFTVIDIEFTQKKIFCDYQVYDRKTFGFEQKLFEGKSRAEFSYGTPRNVDEKITDKKDFS